MDFAKLFIFKFILTSTCKMAKVGSFREVLNVKNV